MGALSYLTWWALFAAVLFAVGRVAPWPALLLAFVGVSMAIVWIEITSVQSAMRDPGFDGSVDLDGPFMIGLIFKVALVNGSLLPAAVGGAVVRYRCRRVRIVERGVERQ